MAILLAIVVGILFGTGVYMLLRRSIVKLIIGLGILGHGANLLIFTISDITRKAPVVLPALDVTQIEPSLYVDPLPQALILTAIVIGFGVQAFALILVKKVSDVTGTDDLDAALLIAEDRNK
jgi:multicomponent Na+:H+ antiporter subunit C